MGGDRGSGEERGGRPRQQRGMGGGRPRRRGGMGEGDRGGGEEWGGDRGGEEGKPTSQRPHPSSLHPASSPAPLPERRGSALPAARPVVVQSPLDVLSDQLRLPVMPSGQAPTPRTVSPGHVQRIDSLAGRQTPSSLCMVPHAHPLCELTPSPHLCPCPRPRTQPRRPGPGVSLPLAHTRL